MNYTNLFPKLLKNIPRLPSNAFCYDCINLTNYNKKSQNINNLNNLRCFIPSGKRLILWFLKHDSNYYSVLLEYQSSKIVKCHFKYISFDKILTSGIGTMIWVTQVGQELVLNKLIYLKGKYYKPKLIGEQMEELRFLLENRINNLYHSSLMQLKLPVISNTTSVLSFASNLNYSVYNIVSLKNNYNIHINNFMAVFWISCNEHIKDCYSLFYKNKDGKMTHHQTALVNTPQSSNFLKRVLNIKYKKYENIEMSDEEESDNHYNSLNGIYVHCLYDKNHKRWKPYKICKNTNLLSDIFKINALEEKSSRL